MKPWDDGSRPEMPKDDLLSRLRVARRLVLIAVLIFGFIPPMLIARLLGAVDVSQWIVGFVCRRVLGVIGLRLEIEGTPMKQGGGVVANHSSWLDIFVLNAKQKVFFVSKSEVSSWPVIGFVARMVGTVFIERKQTKAHEQKKLFENHLAKGHKLLFFPEGTSTDGRHVMPFKSSLFAAYMDQENAYIQPVSVFYQGDKEFDPRVYGWWGDMDFAPHFLGILAMKKQGFVRLTFHDPMAVADFDDRKALAKAAEEKTREGLN